MGHLTRHHVESCRTTPTMGRKAEVQRVALERLMGPESRW